MYCRGITGKFVIIALVLASLLVGLPLGCSSPSASPPASPTAASVNYISIGTSQVGGSYFVVGSALAAVISKYMNIKSTAEIGGGAVVNLQQVVDRQLELGVSTTPVLGDAYLGQGDFKTKLPVRLLFRGHSNPTHIITPAGSGISTIEGMKGKKVQGLFKANPLFDKVTDLILRAYGLSLADVNALYWTSIAESVNDLRDGNIDVFFQPTSSPVAAIQELFLIKPMRLISLDAAKADSISSKNPGLPGMKIPAGTYKGQDTDITTIGWLAEIASRDDLPDDVAYGITKSLYDHFDEFAKSASFLKEYSLATAMSYKSFPAPFHAGTVRYLKEKGVWTAGMEARQKELLALTGASK